MRLPVDWPAPSRRSVGKSFLLAAASAWRAVRAASAEAAPGGRLTPWMYMIYPLEQWLPDYRRTFDAWAEGGVRGIVIGPLRFWDGPPTFDFTYRRAGARIAAFAPNPAVYRKFGVDPPENVQLDAAKEKQLRALLDDAAGRGWEIMLFGPGHYGRRKSFAQDPFGSISLAAGVEDSMRALPQVNGVIVDGAGEHHYELAFHHGGELFETRESERPIYEHLGFDLARMERGMGHLRKRFHELTPSLVRYHASGGMLAGLSLFDVNEDALYWLRMRQEATLRNLAAMREQVERVDPKPKLGTIPRAATFSALTTQDYQKIQGYFDYLFPKHYFWHRGFDGMYGTVARWVATLGEWNPGLTRTGSLCGGEVAVRAVAAGGELARGHGEWVSERVLRPGGVQRDAAGAGRNRESGQGNCVGFDGAQSACGRPHAGRRPRRKSWWRRSGPG